MKLMEITITFKDRVISEYRKRYTKNLNKALCIVNGHQAIVDNHIRKRSSVDTTVRAIHQVQQTNPVECGD